MTLRVITQKRKIVFKAPINAVCYILAKAAESNGGVKLNKQQKRGLVRSLRQAKSNFRGLVLADIQTKEGKRIIIKL